MELFTEQQRDEAIEILTDALKECGAQAAVLVGSGAVGFRDGLSDIDMTSVIPDSADKTEFFSRLRERLCGRLTLKAVHSIPFRGLHIMLTENYLELDVSLLYRKELSARRGIWRVLFDNGAGAEDILRRTWEELCESRGAGLDNRYTEAAENVWHTLMYAATAAARGEYLRAFYELQSARDTAADLLCAKYGLESKRWRDADALPENELSALRRTIPAGLCRAELSSAIRAVTGLLYTLLEQSPAADSIMLPRDAMEEYISHVLPDE